MPGPRSGGGARSEPDALAAPSCFSVGRNLIFFLLLKSTQKRTILRKIVKCGGIGVTGGVLLKMLIKRCTHGVKL